MLPERQLGKKAARAALTSKGRRACCRGRESGGGKSRAEAFGGSKPGPCHGSYGNGSSSFVSSAANFCPGVGMFERARGSASAVAQEGAMKMLSAESSSRQNLLVFL